METVFSGECRPTLYPYGDGFGALFNALQKVFRESTNTSKLRAYEYKLIYFKVHNRDKFFLCCVFLTVFLPNQKKFSFIPKG